MLMSNRISAQTHKETNKVLAMDKHFLKTAHHETTILPFIIITLQGLRITTTKADLHNSKITQLMIQSPETKQPMQMQLCSTSNNSSKTNKLKPPIQMLIMHRITSNTTEQPLMDKIITPKIPNTISSTRPIGTV